MSDEEQFETSIQYTGLRGLPPETQAIAVREMTAVVISKNRWAVVSNIVFMVAGAACFCTTCVVCG